MNWRFEAFKGDLAECYRDLVPYMFSPAARAFADWVGPVDAKSVCEVACGTGALTVELDRVLPPQVRLCASDLSRDMVDLAKEQTYSRKVEFKSGDYEDLPYHDHEFGAVFHQYGLMFVKDHQKALEEIARVLEPGGRHYFATWASLEKHDLARFCKPFVAEFFDDRTTPFYDMPYRLADAGLVEDILSGAGYRINRVEEATFFGAPIKAEDAAKYYVWGNSMVLTKCEDEKTALALQNQMALEMRFKLGEEFRPQMSAYFWETTPRMV